MSDEMIDNAYTLSTSVGRDERANGKDYAMARRRYQHGYITKRGPNWVVRYREDVMQEDGGMRRVERTHILLPSNAPKKEARREADRFLSQLNAGRAHPQM